MKEGRLTIFSAFRFITITGSVVLLCNPIFCQYAENIESGRPGQAFGPTTVGAGVLQIQSGFDFAGSELPGQENRELRTNHFLRLGISERFEFNSLIEYKNLSVDTTGSPGKTIGFSPLYSGFTIHAVDGQTWIPDLTFHAGLYFPTGANEFRVSDPAPQILLITGHNLTNALSFTTNWGLNWDGSSAGAAWKYILNLAISLPHGIGLFVENYGTGDQGELSTWFDGGAAWIIKSNLQLDLFAGYGKNGEQKDFFVSAGLSWRIGGRDASSGAKYDEITTGFPVSSMRKKIPQILYRKNENRYLKGNQNTS